MKRLLLSVLAAFALLSAIGQERLQAYVQTDLTSAYLWRGQKNAGVSLQPVAGLKWHGVNLYLWGNVQVTPPPGKPDKHEIDIFLKYSPCRAFTVGFKNVYLNTRGDGFLSYGSIPHAANGLDALLAFDLRYVNFEWTTTIAGYDGYNHSGRRAYGSYLVANAPFSLAGLDWNAQVGVVPYYCSRYSDDRASGFHVNMLALKASHTFTLSSTPGLSFTPYSQLMVNPSARTAYMQVALRVAFAPK